MDDSLAQRTGFVRRTLTSLRWRNFACSSSAKQSPDRQLADQRCSDAPHSAPHRGGVVLACCGVPVRPDLLLSAWAGVIVDRTNKRNLLYITQALEMCESFALARWRSFTTHARRVLRHRLAGGALLALDNPVRRTFVNEMVPRDDITNAVTLYSAMNSMARIADRFRWLLIVTVGYDGASRLTPSLRAVITALAMMRTAELRGCR